MKQKIRKAIDELVQTIKNELSDKKEFDSIEDRYPVLDEKQKKTLSTLRVLADGNNVETFFCQVANVLLNKLTWSPITQTTMPFTTEGGGKDQHSTVYLSRR